MSRRYTDALRHDLRFAVRSMARTPGFTAVALLMIALGTGANAAMFSIIDAVLVRSPFPDSARLAVVRALPAAEPLTVAQARGVLDARGVFESIGATGGGGRVTLRGFGEPRRLNTECVTADVFKVLGAQPIAGRTFTADEDRPGGPGAVVLSYQFWQRELGGAADVVGRPVTINGAPVTVVGIMPRAFGGPYSRNNNDGWLPLGPGIGAVSPVGCTARVYLWLFARLRPGATFDATADQATVASGIARIADTTGKTGKRIGLTPLDEQTTGDVRTPLLILLGSVALVLLIACANVANLQMERVFGRRRDTAVRIAIGATRGRIVCQTLTENLLLYAAGCVAGLFAAYWTLDVIVALLPGSMPHLIDIHMNGRILAVTFAVACSAGLLIGVIPAFHASRPRVADDLRASSGTTNATGTWVRSSLVAAQIALSLVLLVGAALLIRTFLTLRPTHPGFTANDKVVGTVRLQGAATAASGRFFEAVFDRLRATPGVQGVTGSTYLPVSGNVGIATVREGDKPFEVFSGIVLPNYFDEMQIPVLQGRGFDARDTAGAPPVAVVNEAFVRRVGIARGGVGAVVDMKGIYGRSAQRQIIGVIRDTRSSGGDTRARPELYEPFAQSPPPMLSLIVRSASPADPRLRKAIADAVTAVDPLQAADRIMPLADLLDDRVDSWRFGAWLLGAFAAIAVTLAAIGLAASTAWWITQRTREIGLRVALGASPRQVTLLVVRQALAIATAGTVIGLGGALASTRVLTSWLYGVSPLDLPTFLWSAMGILAIAAMVSYLPARRAARIDPMLSLRAD
jgi:putative ABC transport system permease protein